MAKKESKSKAELYRQERKERIAKANKKNARSIEKTKTVGAILKKAVAIVLVAAIVFGIGYYVFSLTGIAKKMATAVTFKDGDKVSEALFAYYYSSTYSQTVQYSQMLAQYGYSGSGYDTNTAPDKQTTQDADGNEITYAEYFRTSAIDRVKYIKALYEEAKAAGFELDEDGKAEVEETINNYRDSAKESGYSLGAYLKQNFGAGFGEKMFKEAIEMNEIAIHYAEQKKTELGESITEEELTKEYKDNQKLYDYTDLHYYIFKGTALEAEEGESDEALKTRQEKANKELFAKVEKVADKVTNLDTFEAAVAEYLEAESKADAEEAAADADTAAADETAEAADTAEDAEEAEEEETKNTTEVLHATYDKINSALNDAAADWAFDKARKAGETSMFTDETDAYIVIVDKPAYVSHSVDVRHLLVKFGNEDDQEVSQAQDEEALKKANEYLAEWKNGDATEDSFAEMVKKYSEDDGSVDKGGLYAGMRITDSYVEPFLNWSFDPARKVGDVEIIKTEYGYHIMYFVADNKDDVDWKNTIRTDRGDDLYAEFEEGILADDGKYAPEVNVKVTERVRDDFCKRINKNLALSSN